MLDIIHDPRTHSYQGRSARWWRCSWITSSVAHAALVVFLATDFAALLFIFLGLSSPPRGIDEPIVLEVTIEEERPPEPPPFEFNPIEPYDSQEAFAAAEAVAGNLDFEDPALQQPLDYDFQANQNADSAVTDMRTFVERNLDAAISQANQQSAEENLENLDSLAQRLEQTSSAESIEAVTGVIGRLMGTSQRATRPAKEPVAGVFQFDSGQLDDVIRKEKEPDGFIYVAILVDAEGRTFEVEFPGPEGKQAFDAFEKMKQYPFLDQIYRGVVMSLLDGMIPK